MVAPDGGTTVRTFQPDGRLASVTGSAVVAQYYSYGVESDGRQWSQVNSGSASSPRLQKSWADWLGRTTATQSPLCSLPGSVSGGGNFLVNNTDDGTTGQLVKQTRTGYAPTLYLYNALGQLWRTGLDTGNNGILDPWASFPRTPRGVAVALRLDIPSARRSTDLPGLFSCSLSSGCALRAARQKSPGTPAGAFLSDTFATAAGLSRHPPMNKILSVLTLGILLAAPALLPATIIRNVEKTFTVHPGGHFKAVTTGGDITIKTADIGEVRITAREVVRDSSEAEADVLLKKVDLRLEQSGDNITAEAKYESSGLHVAGETWHEKLGLHWGGPPVTVSFIVTLPLKFNASLHTSGGDIAVANLTGNVRAQTSGGSLNFDRIEGDLEAGTSGGDITLKEGTAHARLHTSGGNIHVARAGGPTEVETSGGNIVLESVADLLGAHTSGGDVRAVLTAPLQHDVNLSTSGGNVSVQLGRTVACLLDAGTSGGGGEATGLTLTIEKGGVGKSHLVGAVNGGGPRLKLRTSGGDIQVRAE